MNSSLLAVPAFVAMSFLVATGCQGEKKAPPPAPQQYGSVPFYPSNQPSMAPYAPGGGGGGGGGAGAMPGGEGMASVSGTVAETMDSGGYTYVRLTTATGDRWAAVSQTKVTVGQAVTVVNPLLMKGFVSKTLNRTFDEIYFGSLGAPGAAGAAGGDPHAGMPGMPGMPGTAAPAPTGDIKVEPVAKATGANAKTIAEIWAGKTALKDKPVVVRGKVTKYNAGILGKNWIHIQDGTGTAAAADNDITATTTATAALGDVVTIKGVVHLDKDFGGGYAYKVIIEEATVEK